MPPFLDFFDAVNKDVLWMLNGSDRVADTDHLVPYKTRLDVPGALYHVISRCRPVYRLFLDDRDRELFLSLISKIFYAAALNVTSGFSWIIVTTLDTTIERC